MVTSWDRGVSCAKLGQCYLGLTFKETVCQDHISYTTVHVPKNTKFEWYMDTFGWQFVM